MNTKFLITIDITQKHNKNSAVPAAFSRSQHKCDASVVTYAAAAPKISCLFALVNTDKTAENSSVHTSKIAIHTPVA